MEKTKDLTQGFYRIAYSLFILLAIYQVFVRKDFVDAASNMGIGLVFDPFNPKISWKERPNWQKAWLLIHLAIAAALLGYGISLGE